MQADDEVQLTAAEVLRLYAEGRRDFQKLTIGPDAESFANTRLDGVDFSFSFVDANFGGASLRGARFVNSNVKACIFDRADLSNASFQGAMLDAATFARADLSGATFVDATWHSHVFDRHELPNTSHATYGRHERFRRALAAPKPSDALYALAVELRDEGETEAEVLGLFNLFFSEHSEDADETLLDAILDTMDCIVGWCPTGTAIF